MNNAAFRIIQQFNGRALNVQRTAGIMVQDNYTGQAVATSRQGQIEILRAEGALADLEKSVDAMRDLINIARFNTDWTVSV